MKIYGLDSIQPMLESDSYLFKLVANELGVIFFPHTVEHCDVKQPGISYSHDSAGNALAAMVLKGLIEFRYHQAFSDERVRNLSTAMQEHPDLFFISSFAVTYQGRVLFPGYEVQ